ncbi:MAG: O-antigen ligase family protein [Crocinitomicaceae bacterium]
MVVAYKEHIQFIMILVVMYVMGVWLDPTIYLIFPIMMLLFGVKKHFFELLICTLWLLILSDYIPVDNATYADLQFAKDLKPMVPIILLGFFLLNRERFAPYPKFIFYFIPFFIVAAIGLNDSLDFQVGAQKTISFILMYMVIPLYVNLLHREHGEFFWRSLFTFIIGMLAIGIVLGIVVPQIGVLEGANRFKGIFGNPNGVGIFLNLTFILWIVLEEFGLLKLTKKERWVTLLVILISLFWSGSRNGIMSITLFYLIYRLTKINWFLALIAVAVFIIFSDFIFDAFVEFVSFFGLEGYFRVNTLEEGSGRQVAWAFAWIQIQDYFFVGGGFGHDEHVMRPNYHWLVRKGHEGGVHNSYLSLWFDTGIIGLIMYFGAIFRVVFSSFKQHYIVLAFIVSLLFNITYESWLVASLNPFTIMLVIILTIFAQNFRGEQAVVEDESVSEKN